MSRVAYSDVMKGYANAIKTCGGHAAHSEETCMKTIVLLCALAFGFSSIAFAGPADPQQSKPPVDCKKNPKDPSCKAKK